MVLPFYFENVYDYHFQCKPDEPYYFSPHEKIIHRDVQINHACSR